MTEALSDKKTHGRLLTCDVICLGVGSPKAWNAYVRWLGERHGAPVMGYRHRAKAPDGTPLPGDQATFADGTTDADSDDVRQWMRLFKGRQILRPSCHGCPYHSTRRASDVTIGEFAGLDPASPLADGQGTSVVIVADPEGELAQALARAMTLEPHSMAEAANPTQLSLRESVWVGAWRTRMFAGLTAEGFSGVVRAKDDEEAMQHERAIAAARAGLPKPTPVRDDTAATIGARVRLPDGSTLVNRLVQHVGDCCGCGACAAACPVGAIAMNPDAEGFAYPVICEDACVGCGLCEEACGFARVLEDPTSIAPAEGPAVWAAKHRSAEVRTASSSGGAFWALAEHVISTGGVVYGCAYDAHMVTRHVRCQTLEECAHCRTPKYSQSVVGTCYEDVRDDLAAGRTVLFTGTPCQVDALERYLELSEG